MKWSRYPQYKDSGIEWLGEIPEGWDMIKLKFLTNKEKYSFVDGPFGSDLKNEEYTDTGIPLIQLNNIGIGEHDLKNLKFINEEKADKLFKHKIFPDDVVIAKMAGPVARAAKVKPDFKEYVVVADCLKFKPATDLLNPDFMVYSMNTNYTRIQAEQMSTGTTRIRIGLSDAKVMKILLPSLDLQKEIVQYLDQATSRIDGLIEKKEKQIELLKEKRAALISRAVTKGLAPNVKMKDSGIDWLGEIPQGWDIIKLKFLTNKEKYSFVDGPFGSDLKNEEYTDTGIPLIQLNNIGIGEHDLKNLKFINEEKADKLLKHKIFPDDVVIAKMAEPVARAAKVKPDFKEYVVVADCLKFKPATDLLNPDFMVYTMNTNYTRIQAEQMSTGTTRIRIGLSDAKVIKILLPALDVQQEIVQYLDRETTKIDSFIEKVQKSIGLLKEYRTAIISAAVTGKIDVRETV